MGEQLTKKGEMIRDYITSRQLARGGHGFIVMGAMIGGDGHARECHCHVGCSDDCDKPGHGWEDHGKVTYAYGEEA